MRENRPINQVRVGLVGKHAVADGRQESHGSGRVCRKEICDWAGHSTTGMAGSSVKRASVKKEYVAGRTSNPSPLFPLSYMYLV